MRVCFHYVVWAGSCAPEPMVVGRRQAWASLPKVLGSDYLVRFQKRLPRDLQAKCDSADVVHDALLLACRDLHEFHGVTDEKLRQWLHSACRHRRQNLARDYRQRRKRQVGREVSLDDAYPSDGHVSEPVARTLNPSDQAIQHEEEEHARAAFARLSGPDRDILSLKLDEDLTFAEAGARLGSSGEAARKAYSRALKRFKQLLGEVVRN